MSTEDILKQVLSLGDNIEELRKKEAELTNIFDKLIDNPPETMNIFNGWSYDRAVTILLHFIEAKGLNQEIIDFLKPIQELDS